MMSMKKQRGIYAAGLSMVLAVTLGISLYTASGDEGEDYTAEAPEVSVVEEVEIPEKEEVQQDLIERNQQIEAAEKPVSETSENEEEQLDEAEAEAEVEAKAESRAEIIAETEAKAQDPVASGFFFDPAVDSLAWPVSGNVVMEYSLDQVIYDATLDQFRINDSISIAGAAAENVCAAAAGIVTEIGYTEELGHYVVLEHGNGFRTTYGQMQDNFALAVGERVEEGNVLGQLAEPVQSSVALGDHLTFKVTLNGEAVDPLEYLEYEEE